MANKALHRTAITLRSIAASELGRSSIFECHVRMETPNFILSKLATTHDDSKAEHKVGLFLMLAEHGYPHLFRRIDSGIG